MFLDCNSPDETRFNNMKVLVDNGELGKNYEFRCIMHNYRCLIDDTAIDVFFKNDGLEVSHKIIG